MAKTALIASARELQHLERMGEFLRVIAATHRLRGMRGQANALLIGSPGYGKTQALLRLEGNGGVLTLSDTTFLGVLKMLDKAKHGYLSTVIIPDLGPALARDLPQVRKVIALCSAAIEEGVKNIVVGKLEKNYGGARFGVLAAVTHDDIGTHYNVLKGSGFLSRFILLEVTLTEEALIVAAQRDRDGDRSLVSALRLPDARDVTVDMPDRYDKDAEKLWRDLVKKREDRASGFRGLHMYKALLAAIAYLRAPFRPRVTQKDVDLFAWYHEELLLTQLKYSV